MAEEKNNRNDKNDDILEILGEVKGGSSEAFEKLKNKYSPLVASLIRSFEGDMTDRSEYEREAEYALLKAALKFNLEQGEVKFGLFAKICIRNSLISVKRKEMSRKRRNEKYAKNEARDRHIALYIGDASNSAETQRLVEKIRAVLSPFEKLVFDEYMLDKSTKEIAFAVGKPRKSVNNAIYRIKIKALEIL